MFSYLLLGLSAVTTVAQAAFPDPQTLWKGPALNASDALYAGLQQIPGVKHIQVYDGSTVGRTYAHHAIVENFGGRLFAAWSSALNDEDSMGQQVWVNTAERTNNGVDWTWGTPMVAVRSALLANQTSLGERNYTFWCSSLVRNVSYTRPSSG